MARQVTIVLTRKQEKMVGYLTSLGMNTKAAISNLLNRATEEKLREMARAVPSWPCEKREFLQSMGVDLDMEPKIGD